jgi:hypothetical protein
MLDRLAFRYLAGGSSLDEKIRKSKGVPNSVKLGEIFPFLVGLGFTVKDTVKFIGGDLQRSTGNPAEMDSLYSNLQTMSVASLPHNPTSGTRCVTDLRRSSPTEVQYRIHDAVPGYEILSPHGKEFHLLSEYPGGPVRVNPALNNYNTLAEKFVFEVDLFFDPISYWEPHLRKMREILTTDQINPAQLSFVF